MMTKKNIIIAIAVVAVAAFAYGAKDGVCPITGNRLWGNEACEMKKEACERNKEACAAKKEACKTCEAGEECKTCDAKKLEKKEKKDACCSEK